MSAFLVTPLGSLVARDGRPFGNNSGVRMRLAPWLYPSVAAGSFRTFLGKQQDGGFTPDLIEELKSTAVAGPLPVVAEHLCFPAPRDLVLREDAGGATWVRIRPEILAEGEGADFPGSLLPAGLDPSVDDCKPGPAPPWWTAPRMTEWLLDELPHPPGAREDWLKNGFAAGPEPDLRTHLELNDDSGANVDGMLFQTAGFQFHEHMRLAVRVTGSLAATPGIHPFGGERRLAAWSGDSSALWDCPRGLAGKLESAERIRLILATPALFRHGWKPDWLDGHFCGTIPGSSCRVRLVSACLEPWKPVSGWSLDTRNFGEKPVRRLVPAGAVYFFERLGGELAADKLWLQPVSDGEQARFDGFGLALWGKWTTA